MHNGQMSVTEVGLGDISGTRDLVDHKFILTDPQAIHCCAGYPGSG
jgi:hypothetical protein